MYSLLCAFKRACVYLFRRGPSAEAESPARPPFQTHHVFSVTFPPPPPSAPMLPDFDFRPSDRLLASLESDAIFSVANPLDLALQSQDLMANVLVVEVSTSTSTSMLWFRFDSASLVARGMSACCLFSDDNTGVSGAEHVADGVCGWVIDRKRV